MSVNKPDFIVNIDRKLYLTMKFFENINLKSLTSILETCNITPLQTYPSLILLKWETIKILSYHMTNVSDKFEQLNKFRYNCIRGFLNNTVCQGKSVQCYDSLSLTGSENIDSDIDVTIMMPTSQITCPNCSPQTAFARYVTNLWKESKEMSLDEQALIDAFDINFYLANFILTKNPNVSNDKYIEIRKLQFNTQEFYLLQFLHKEFLQIQIGKSVMMLNVPGRVLFRMFRMFTNFDTNPYLDGIAKQYPMIRQLLPKSFTNVEQLVNGKEYMNTVHKIYDLLNDKKNCSRIDFGQTLEKLMFYATLQVRDQYYSSWTFQSIVIRQDVVQKDDESNKRIKTEMIWDHLGMMYHLLTLAECNEKYWFRKCLKYIHRIFSVDNTCGVQALEKLQSFRVDFQVKQNKEAQLFINRLTQISDPGSEWDNLCNHFLEQLCDGDLQTNIKKYNVFSVVFRYALYKYPFFKLVDAKHGGDTTSYKRTSKKVIIKGKQRNICLCKRVQYVKWFGSYKRLSEFPRNDVIKS